MEIKLHTLPPGETARILAVSDGGRGLSDRLRDLGFTKDAEITFVRAAPLGDPLAYRIRGTLIALRREDAACITVQHSSGEGGILCV